MKLHAQLENTLKIRINSNEEIIPGIKKLAEMGKFDKPKENALFAIILDRLGKMEDEAAIQDSLKENNTNAVIEDIASDGEDDFEIKIHPQVNTGEDKKEIDISVISGDGSDGAGNDETIANTPSSPVNEKSSSFEVTETAENVDKAISEFNLDTIVDKPQEENPA